MEEEIIYSVEEISKIAYSNKFWELGSGTHLNMIDFLIMKLEEKEEELNQVKKMLEEQG